MSNFMGTCLERCAQYNPEGEMLVYSDQRITWKALYQRVQRLAAAMSALGIERGDRVIVMFHNRPEFFEVNYAAQMLGAIPVPMNYRFSEREVAFQANHCGAKAFFLEDLWLETVEGARDKIEKMEHYICLGLGSDSMLDYDTFIEQQNLPDFPSVDTSLEDICVICYTGGTTGMPKGVMLTYGNHTSLMEAAIDGMLKQAPSLLSNPALMAKLGNMKGWQKGLLGSKFTRWTLERHSVRNLIKGLVMRMVGTPRMIRMSAKKPPIKVMMPSFPLFHDAAYVSAILGPLMGNQCLVCLSSPRFDGDEVLSLIESEKPVALGNVPTGWRMLLDTSRIDEIDKSSIKVALTGAGICHAALKRKIFQHFPDAVLVDGFGQTEMAPATSVRIDFSPDTIKEGSVGKPIVQTRIVDDSGNVLPEGQTGEIIYKSQTVMKGYYTEPGKTSEVIKDGWFYSGDLGYFDEDGDLRILERKNECISSGGEKIFPHEIEDILQENSAVAAACVIGVPDEKWGKAVRAVVQLKAGHQVTDDELLDWCSGRMAGYKKPRSLVFVDELPVNPVGKIQRGKVREYWGEAGQKVVAS